jgi:biotin synthase
MGTHLIVGLGETEQEMSTILQEMVDRQITVGLFAFTPVRGTSWGKRQPPALASYRRIQAARYLMSIGVCRVQDFTFSTVGQLLSYGLNRQRLCELLADGRAFQTAGCPGCNRPYYNERPGRAVYNYPRPLYPKEIEAAISLVLSELT